jgi:hypothetical protein
MHEYHVGMYNVQKCTVMSFVASHLVRPTRKPPPNPSKIYGGVASGLSPTAPPCWVRTPPPQKEGLFNLKWKDPVPIFLGTTQYGLSRLGVTTGGCFWTCANCL